MDEHGSEESLAVLRRHDQADPLPPKGAEDPWGIRVELEDAGGSLQRRLTPLPELAVAVT